MARAPGRRLRRPGGFRRRRRDPARLGGRPPGVVSGGVRLGCGMHVQGHVADQGAGSQPDRREHVVPPRTAGRGRQLPNGHGTHRDAASRVRRNRAVHPRQSEVGRCGVPVRAGGCRPPYRARGPPDVALLCVPLLQRGLVESACLRVGRHGGRSLIRAQLYLPHAAARGAARARRRDPRRPERAATSGRDCGRSWYHDARLRPGQCGAQGGPAPGTGRSAARPARAGTA